MTKILMIDDNPEFLKLAKELLSSYNVEVDTLDDGKLAVLKIRSFDPDIIFLDYDMDDIRATDVLKGLNKLADIKDIPIIILTGTNDTLHECFALGAKGYLTKESKYLHLEILKWVDTLGI